MNSDIHALSGAYAVDALDDDERAEFERHLAECPACRGEVASLREASALLAETTAVQPPPELRAALLAGIGTVRPLPPEVQRPATVTELAPRRRRRTTAWLAAAAAVVAVGAGGVIWQTQRDDGLNRVEQIEAASDVQSYSATIGDATVTVYRSKKLNEAAVVTHDMPAAPSGHAYALWLQHDDVMVPAGIMPTGPDNEVVLSGDAASAIGAGITVETAGEEPTKPSDDVVALFTFDA